MKTFQKEQYKIKKRKCYQRDINVQCGNVIEARRRDINLIDKSERKRVIIDTAVPVDVKVGEKEREKVENYHD